MRAATRARSSSCTRVHQAGLYRFIRRLLGTALAAQTDEVFQDTWLKVVHQRERWAPQGATFRTWLFTLAHHRVIDLLRRSGREVSVNAFEDEGDEPWQPEAEAWQHWPAPAAACAAGRGPRVLAAGRREAAVLPRAAAAGTAQRVSCCITTTASPSTRSRARSRSASRPRKRGLRYAMSKLRTCMGAYLEPLQTGGAR
jgi:RNA polymerase sigma-70 factor (ECF subfamily)